MIRSNATALEARIRARLSKYLPESEKAQEALQRIGMIVRSEIILNVTRKNIIDTERLRKSIDYQIDGNSVAIGSFGVPYAKYHEYGANLGPRGMRAMFAAMRARAKTAKRYKAGGKKVIVNGVLRARPFVRPAWNSKLAQVRKILAEYGAL